MSKNEVLLDGDNFCKGRVTAILRDSLEEIAERIAENGDVSGAGTVTIKVAFSVDVEAGTVRASVAEPKVTKPKAKSEGQIIRLGSGGPTVDLEEDGVGNRSLPFTMVVSKGGE